MKLIIIPALFVSLFAFHPAYAVGAYDLQCLLDNGEQMTLSHVSNTVYISFENPGGDSEESGSVIKLDIPSGEAKQTLAANPGAGTASFTLRGENEDIEGAVAVNYSEYDGTGDAYYTAMNAMGQETSTVSCKPGTIKVSRSLLQNGINSVRLINLLPLNNSRHSNLRHHHLKFSSAALSVMKAGIPNMVLFSSLSLMTTWC